MGRNLLCYFGKIPQIARSPQAAHKTSDKPTEPDRSNKLPGLMKIPLHIFYKLFILIYLLDIPYGSDLFPNYLSYSRRRVHTR